MSDSQDSENLQFERAEFPSGEGMTCRVCGNPVSGEYFLVNGHGCCPSCRWSLDSPEQAGGSGSDRFLKAAVYGLLAAVAGTGLYFGIRWITGGWEFSLVAIAVGWLVGKAVFIGSENRGGRGYQAMAVLLTYSSIVSSYLPLFLQEVEAHGAMDYIILFLLACAAPFLGGIDNILGLVIIGIGLWQAWKLTAKRELVIEGPFTVTQ